MIFKKIFKVAFYSFILLNSGSLWAKGFNGFYAGGQIGYVSSVCYDTHILTALFFEDFENTFGIKGWDIGGQIGWGKSWSVCQNLCFYTGIEGVGRYVNARGENDLNVLTTPPFPPGLSVIHAQRAKIRNTFQLALRLGLPICHTVMPFIKLGYANTLWKIEDRHGDVEQISGLEHVITRKRQLSGFLTGFGADIRLCTNWLFGLEWEYSFYSKQTIALGTESPSSDTGAVMIFKPRYARVGARFSYIF